MERINFGDCGRRSGTRLRLGLWYLELGIFVSRNFGRHLATDIGPALGCERCETGLVTLCYGSVSMRL